MVLNGIYFGLLAAFLAALLLYLGICFFLAESVLTQTFRGELLSDSEGRTDPRALRGVEDALQFVLKGHKDRKNQRLRPEIAITPEVGPVARVSRRLGGSGVILVSQGLIDCVTDEDLVRVLNTSVDTLSKSGVVIRSALSTSWLHVSPLYLAPWTPIGALFSWGALPLGRFLYKSHESLDILSSLNDRGNLTHSSLRLFS